MPTRSKLRTPPVPARPRRVAVEGDAAQVLRQFRQVFNAVKAHFQQVEKTVGLGGAQVWALSIVQSNPGLGVGTLARAMDIHQSTASNLVRTLTERGLVAASREETDRRAVHLRLLPAGARLLRRAPEPLTGLLPAAIGSLDPVTLARLKDDLATLIVALGVDTRGARIPIGR
jgi:DNA-binding MarR family transcriptional regulator